ncbi:MAG: hypothetical protein A3G81_04475 [Betaproteobacteria bacterium RIFCSPLOWO2_12_FULL_65_14]|nr:MAG: hypothetical protein A3G81_04475 [Betaproteobacteria bacterium RIFCSPLOWO2_12_FULL_65_14]
MPFMDWKQAIERWRALPQKDQARIRRDRIPLNVAESMAFEGEPVELAALRAELARLDTLPATSKHALAS